MAMAIAHVARAWSVAVALVSGLTVALAAPAWSQDLAAEWEAHMRAGAQAYGLAQMDIAGRELDAALALAEKNFANDDVKMINTWLNLVPLRRAQGKLAEAAAMGEQLLARLAKAEGDNSPELMAPLVMVAATYRDLKDWANSDKHYQRTIALHDEYYGDAHPRTITMLEDRAVMLGLAGRTAESVELFTDVVDRWQYGLGPSHIREAISRRGFAEALRKVGREADAVAQEKLADEITIRWEAGR
jgi:tetratricopeptide (TPR) repeat protein